MQMMDMSSYANVKKSKSGSSTNPNNNNNNEPEVSLMDYYKDVDISKTTNENEDKISKIIIQTWKTNNIPINYKSDVKSIQKLNSEYKYLFFSDEDIETFLQENYPEYYETYKKFPIKIQRFDFFRYIAVYHYGGFYFDLDMTGLANLDDLLDYDCVFPIDEFISKEMCNIRRYRFYCDHNINFLLGQYAFAAKKNNVFIKKLIDYIHKNIDRYISIHNENTDYENYVYKTTGPDFVTDMYLDFNDKNSVHVLHYNKRQYFGKYARHNFRGTWKH
jgi:mannosyltransferase OCH1-like enzyme